MKPKVKHGAIARTGPGPVQCEDCKAVLQAGDPVAHTLDMKRFWHSTCFEKLPPFKDWPKAAQK